MAESKKEARPVFRSCLQLFGTSVLTAFEQKS